MRKHLEQASHNQDFHDCIEQEFSNNFFDWKITTLFYIALHWLKALAIKRGKDIGHTHADVEKSVNPARTGSTMKIKQTAWKNYKSLHLYSHSARYEGITDMETFQKLKQVDHENCLRHISEFKKYIEGQGIDTSCNDKKK